MLRQFTLMKKQGCDYPKEIKQTGEDIQKENI